MEDKHMISYEPPVAEVIEVKTEGLICTSPVKYYSPFSGEGEDW
jgi:hypothetical protein